MRARQPARAGLLTLLACLVLCVALAPYAQAADELVLKIESALAFRDKDAAGGGGIDVKLTPDSTRDFAKWSARYVGKRIKLMVDGREISRPMLMSKIEGGHIRMSGFVEAETGRMIAALVSGTSKITVDIANPIDKFDFPWNRPQNAR